MADVAAMLAEAFTEVEAGELVVTPVPTSNSGTVTSSLSSNYATPMLNVIRFLSAVAITSPTNTFQTAWSQTSFAGSVPDLTAAMQGVYALSTKHLSEVFYNLSEESRRYFHAQCLQLSENVAKDMAELSLATALLRWLTQAALPALQVLPEASAMNTAEILRKNYAAVDYACLVARPDDSNPEFQKMAGRIAGLEKELLAEQKKSKALQLQLQQQQNTVVVASTSPVNKFKVTAIALGSALFAAVVIIALLASLYYKNSKSSSGFSPSLRSPMLGGISGSGSGPGSVPVSAPSATPMLKNALDVLSNSGREGTWGFAALI